MSRFFTGGSSSEDESDVSRSGSESDEREVKPAPKVTGRFGGYQSSDSEDDSSKKRVVRSAKDKAIEEFRASLTAINNHIRINDWNALVDDFENLNKLLTKSQRVLNPEGNQTPRVYIKALAVLEDFVKTTQENKDKVKLSTLNAKSFNAMRQTLKKHNKKYEKDLEEYRKNPDVTTEAEPQKADESDESESAGSSDESEEEKEPSDDEKDSGSESESSSGSEYKEEEEEKGPSRWLLKADKDKKPAEKEKKEKKEKAVRQTKKVKIDDEKSEKRHVEMTPEEVKRRLKEILSARGKRNTDPQKQVEQLKDLLTYAKDAELLVEIYTHMISAHFDTNPSIATHMPVPMWRNTLEQLNRMVAVLEANPSMVLHEADEPEPQVEQSFGDDEGDDEDAPQMPVQANLMSFVERLDEEYTKSLQAIDPHTIDYVQRVGDEALFLELAERIQAYYERSNKFKRVARIASRRLEHIYYKLEREDRPAKPASSALAASSDGPATATGNDTTAASTDETVPNGDAAAETATSSNEASQTSSPKPRVSSKALMDRLTSLIYTHGDERLKTRAMLCHIYYHALHERFYQARDMMLMSHLQDSIGHMDIPTQILFNRTMAQLGLCAFRDGLVKQAHSCLAELYSGGRVKELLGQGITSSRYSERNPEQEKQERRRQYPFHMHINAEMLESVHLISAMLLEVPNMALNAVDPKKKIISKNFRKWLRDLYERPVFNGPPEDFREAVIVASIALGKGDWKKTTDLLTKLNLWNHLQNAENVKSMLKRKIQEEALRTYLFSFSVAYDSIGIDQLTQMFELPANTVHSIVSSMMISEEIHASWDQPTNSIIMHRVEPTRLQFLAQQFAEKAALLVENNERMLETKAGNFAYNRFDNKQGQQRGNWVDNQRTGGGGRGGYRGTQGGRGGYRAVGGQRGRGGGYSGRSGYGGYDGGSDRY